MELIEMKRAPKEVNKMMEPCGINQDPYPYGLEISLQEEEIDKLGIDVTKVTAGEEIVVKAIASVKEVSEEKRMVDGKEKLERRLRFQIEKLGIKFQNDFENSFDEAAGKEK